MMEKQSSLASFLVEAKKQTYASGKSDYAVAPLLTGAKQLEYRQRNYLYRDLYFGSSYFVGQETVELDGTPLWAMSYAGGMLPENPTHSLTETVYTFLRQALLMIPKAFPYRGPEQFEAAPLQYINHFTGTLELFQGKETVLMDNHAVYALGYQGGLLS